MFHTLSINRVVTPHFVHKQSSSSTKKNKNVRTQSSSTLSVNRAAPYCQQTQQFHTLFKRSGSSLSLQTEKLQTLSINRVVPHRLSTDRTASRFVRNQSSSTLSINKVVPDIAYRQKFLTLPTDRVAPHLSMNKVAPHIAYRQRGSSFCPRREQLLTCP